MVVSVFHSHLILSFPPLPPPPSLWRVRSCRQDIVIRMPSARHREHAVVFLSGGRALQIEAVGLHDFMRAALSCPRMRHDA